MPYSEYIKIYQTVINMEYLSTFTASEIIHGTLFYLVVPNHFYTTQPFFYEVIS